VKNSAGLGNDVTPDRSIVHSHVTNSGDVSLSVWIVGLTVTLLVLLATLVFWFYRSASSKRRSILLVGLSDGGKTLLFSKLVHHQNFSTQSSIQENVSEYSAGEKTKKKVKLVDIPGHDRLRHLFIDKFKATARGIIIVVDSVTFQKDVKDVAEMMHTLLTDKTIAQITPSVLIACNKHDQALAKGSKLVQSSLEKELNAARITKSASLATTDGAKSGSVFLGHRGQDFTFADIKQFRVEFVEISAKGSKTIGVEPIEEWIAKVS